MSVNKLVDVLGATARANKYRVSFAYPSAVQGKTSLEHIDILAKATNAPTKELGQIELWKNGRKLIIPGDTVFDNAWSVDFYLTEDHQFRKDLIEWGNACDNFSENKHAANPSEIFAELKVEQLNSQGEVTATYILEKCFPQTIGEIAYGADSADTPAEFNVIFAYTSWKVA